MLRRNQATASNIDGATDQTIEMVRPAQAQAADRRIGDRRTGERRQGERRGMEELRAEALQNVISRVEDRNFGGLKSQVQWNRGMKPARILLVVVALASGGIAAYLALQRNPTLAPVVAEPVTQVVQEARAKVLVAKQAIGVGQKLSPASVGWEDWPESTLHPEYITMSAVPQAIEDMSGAVARSEFVAGEPIREQKLVPAGSGGYLAVVLGIGMRGVSVSVTAEAASGGFITPNDRVDVVLTRLLDNGSRLTETILTNVRVLAINARIGEQPAADAASGGAETPTDPEVFAGPAIATLELDATQAEVITNAMTLGDLSLVLRSAADTAGGGKVRPADQLIRMSSPFWKQ